MRRWKRRRNTAGWNVMCWRRSFGFLSPLPPHTVTACFFRPRVLNAGRRHLSPARGPLSLPPSRLMRPRYRPVEFRAPPRFSRRLHVAPVSLCRRPMVFNAVEFRSPRASAAVYLLRPFPSATVRLPPTPLNFVRPAPQSPFACCARFPLPPSVCLQRR